MDSRFSSKGILAVIVSALVLSAFLLWLGSKPSSEEAAEKEEKAFAGGGREEAGAAGDTAAEAEEEDKPETVAEPPAESGDGDSSLPANWHQLSAAQKTTLNPFGCPPDTDGYVHIRFDTGECLQPKDAEADTVPPETSEDEENDPPEENGEKTKSAGFRRPFAYSPDLDVTVHSLTCRLISEELLFGEDNPTREGFWRDPRVTYEEYGDPIPGRERNEETDNPYEGLLDIEQRCRLVMSGTNTGDDRYLPDGCGLNFERSVSLVGQESTYRPMQLQRICTKNIIDFPNGASDREILYFATAAGDRISEIVIRDPRDGESHSIATVRLNDFLPEDWITPPGNRPPATDWSEFL